MKKKLTIEGFIDSLIKSIKKISNQELEDIMKLKDPRLKKSILRIKTDSAYRKRLAKQYGID